ncbi:MAG: NAD-dependent dehydratase [Citrobacter freundii]|nr:MAG: NAD-dependent dehydratase [Citrobacter freundii]
MKIIITGSLGNISQPLSISLIEQKHDITVITSKSSKRQQIEALGAKAAVGDLHDADFLTAVFTDADAVYCMVPPDFTQTDQEAYYRNIGHSYADAIRRSGIGQVVNLSSWGAHLPSGTGFITGSYIVEQILNDISNIGLTHIRPTSFYYNFFHFIPMIKAINMIATVYGGNDKLAMVAPTDIAAAIAEELTATSDHKKIRYVSSDDRTCNEIAEVLGSAIGKPELKWVTITAEQAYAGLLTSGFSEEAAGKMVELNQAIHTGLLREDYDLHLPDPGKVKLEEFAKDFANAYSRA